MESHGGLLECVVVDHDPGFNPLTLTPGPLSLSLIIHRAQMHIRGYGVVHTGYGVRSEKTEKS